ncbi:type I methionyl aminopeptidase [Candidatus Nardonella dryophthoridicola]|uniref:type I methionyl aminopeptidase n=1 Tax=Candidatus Nardonella dryophthoridicola TaxID=1971485 RepID=UPI002A4E1BCB|nr:type I methionyl aminopeptidase [Candidatus Nardonella dryophthoridicola]
MNNINIYNNNDIECIKKSCLLIKNTFNMIEYYIKPNITTELINNICHNYIIKNNGIPACLGYLNFPKSICISINNIVCHGISSNKKKLKYGDIVNIDICINKNGYYCDASKMFFVGKINKSANNLCKIAKKSLDLSISILKEGLKLKYIGKIIQNYVENNNMSVVREFCGHGIGKNLHELPYIHHYYIKNNNFILKEGMIITIEPIINLGTRYIKTMKDG